MRTLLTETPVGPVSAPVAVVVLAAEEHETVRAPAPVAADAGPSLRAPRVPADLLHYSALTLLSTISAGVNAFDRDSASSRASRARLIQKAERIAGRP
jgi:hypothetical protein